MKGSWRGKARDKDASKPKRRRRRGVKNPIAPDAVPDEETLIGYMRDPELTGGYDSFASHGRFWFDYDLAAEKIGWIHTKLKHAKGKLAKQPFNLEPWELAFIANLFGWQGEADDIETDPEADPVRRYKNALLFVARKNGKSPLAACIINLILFEDGEYGAEVYGAASEYNQASLVFDHVRGMILQEESLRNRCKINSGQAKSVQLGEDEGFSTYRPLTADAKSKHGFLPNLNVIDELHTFNDAELVDTLTSGMSGREQPLTVYLTTSDYDRESICNEVHRYAGKVRDGLVPDLRFLPAMFECKKEDDWTDEKTWKKANPNIGISKSWEYMREQCQKAKDEPRLENVFKRLDLNMKTEQLTRDLNMEEWSACEGETTDEVLEKTPCWMGVDLSKSRDITAVCLVWRIGDAIDNHEATFVARWWFWVPAETLSKKAHDDQAPYETWRDHGHLEQTVGAIVDYNKVRAKIKELGEQYSIQEVAIDPHNAVMLGVTLAEEDGFDVMEFPQGWVSMAPAYIRLKDALGSGSLQHNGDPVAKWMAGNVSVVADQKENIQPVKGKSTGRIDGIIALMMALDRAMGEDSVSIYDKRGMIEL